MAEQGGLLPQRHGQGGWAGVLLFSLPPSAEAPIAPNMVPPSKSACRPPTLSPCIISRFLAPCGHLPTPQALVQEEAIRHWASTTAYRMNLAHARRSAGGMGTVGCLVGGWAGAWMTLQDWPYISFHPSPCPPQPAQSTHPSLYPHPLFLSSSSDPALVEQERRRFQRALQPLLAHPGPKLIVTDSQAVDVVHPWTMDPATGEELVPFTTFR